MSSDNHMNNSEKEVDEVDAALSDLEITLEGGKTSNTLVQLHASYQPSCVVPPVTFELFPCRLLRFAVICDNEMVAENPERACALIQCRGSSLISTVVQGFPQD